MSKNPAADAAAQLSGIFTALVATMPLMPPARPANTYSEAELADFAKEANRRISALNKALKLAKEEGAKSVEILMRHIRGLEEYKFEVETQCQRFHDETVSLREENERLRAATRDQRATNGNENSPRLVG